MRTAVAVALLLVVFSSLFATVGSANTTTGLTHRAAVIAVALQLSFALGVVYLWQGSL